MVRPNHAHAPIHVQVEVLNRVGGVTQVICHVVVVYQIMRQPMMTTIVLVHFTILHKINYVVVDYMMLEFKMQQMSKCVNYVEEVAAVVVVIGLHKDIMRNIHVHVLIHVHLVVV